MTPISTADLAAPYRAPSDLANRIGRLLEDEHVRWFGAYGDVPGSEIRLVLEAVTKRSLPRQAARQEAIIRELVDRWGAETDLNDAALRVKARRALTSCIRDSYVSRWTGGEHSPEEIGRSGEAVWIGMTESQWKRLLKACNVAPPPSSQFPGAETFRAGRRPPMIS